MPPTRPHFQDQIQDRDERSSKLRDLLHMHNVGVLDEDGTLGPAVRCWTPAPPKLLGPALVGKEATVRFEADGSWTSLENTTKKRQRARKCFPDASSDGRGPGVLNMGPPGDVRHQLENANYQPAITRGRPVPHKICYLQGDS